MINGFVSVERARAVYKVALDKDLNIDRAQTQALRGGAR